MYKDTLPCRVNRFVDVNQLYIELIMIIMVIMINNIELIMIIMILFVYRDNYDN